MAKEFPISDEEERVIAALGGFDLIVSLADKVLREHGIDKGLFSELDRQRVRRGRDFVKREMEFNFDYGKSLRANIGDLLQQAQDLQTDAAGNNYVGAMLQHLVGAKLDVVLGQGKIRHHGSSVADHSTERNSDFQIEAVAIHVTTHPTEALVRKCTANLNGGLKPVIVTLGDGVAGAEFLLKNSGLADRVDVLDVGQFLTANIYERSLFKAADCKVTFSSLLERYNEIVSSCETDPSLRIRIGSAPMSAN